MDNSQVNQVSVSQIYVVNCFQFLNFMDNSQAMTHTQSGHISCELLSVP